MPYNYLVFNDSREELVEICCQLLCVTLEFNVSLGDDLSNELRDDDSTDGPNKSNLFISYISRIHRDEVNHFYFC